MQKPTQEQLCRIFQAYGIGTEVEVNGEICRITSIYKTCITVVRPSGKLKSPVFSDCQLLLTPMERMSDEDKIEFAEMLRFYNVKVSYKNGVFTIKDGAYEYPVYLDHLPYNIVAFLISKGYLVDILGFNLIECGIAKEKQIS